MSLDEPSAMGMITAICKVRNKANAYDADDAECHTVLYLLDFVLDILATQYRQADRPGVHLGELALSGVRTILQVVEGILYGWVTRHSRSEEEVP